MTFRVISVGWDCPGEIETTLQSIENQTIQDYTVHIVDDATDNPRQAEIISNWCDSRDGRWTYTINTERKFALRNQIEGIRRMNPDQRDVIVWLDLDGDQLAHPNVFKVLKSYYEDKNVDLTYGNYRPIPDMGTSQYPKPFPEEVVRTGSYRHHILTVECCFNHLRTARYSLLARIPDSEYQWPNGVWFEGGADYAVMAACLELAQGNYACIQEVLMLYNHAQPHPDNVYHPAQADQVNQMVLRRDNILARIPKVAPAMTNKTETEVDLVKEVITGRLKNQPYLEPNERRVILRDYARRYGMKILVETGTNLGETMMYLKDDFEALYSIELSTKLYRDAVEKLKAYPQIVLIYGDSEEQLPRVLDAFSGPALIWLDGHHSGPGTARGNLDTPVRKELETLFADGRQHIILVDDARCFAGQAYHDEYPHYADFPSVEWVRDLAAEHNYDCVLMDDIIRLTPREGI